MPREPVRRLRMPTQPRGPVVRPRGVLRVLRPYAGAATQMTNTPAETLEANADAIATRLLEMADEYARQHPVDLLLIGVVANVAVCRAGRRGVMPRAIETPRGAINLYRTWE